MCPLIVLLNLATKYLARFHVLDWAHFHEDCTVAEKDVPVRPPP